MSSRLLAVLVLAALLAAGCGQPPAAEPTPDAGLVDDAVLASGTVVPVRWARLASLSTGRLTWLGPQVGDRVTARQAVARFDDGLPRAQRQAALARVGVARAVLDRAAAGAPQVQAVGARGGSAALPLGERADPETAEAAAHYQEAVAELDVAEAVLAESALLAPFTGTVTARLVNEGEVVPAGTPVLTIADLTRLQVETGDLGEGVVGRVRPGQAVELTFGALKGQTIGGRVLRISPMARSDQGATNYSAVIELDRQEPALRWGMTADVRILTK